MRSLFSLGILILSIGAFAARQSQKNSQGWKLNGEQLQQVVGQIANWPGYRSTDDKELSQAVRQILNSTATFSGKFIQEIARRDGNNFVVSLLGASLVLSIASFGTRGSSASELQQNLGLPDLMDLRAKALRKILDDLKRYKAVELEIVNGVFLPSRIRINDEFKNAIVNVLNMPIQRMNFREGQKSIRMINAWCNDTTHHRIQSIVGQNDLDGNTALVLVNALYFKGKWLHAFEAKETKNQTFTLANGDPKEMQMMRAFREVVYGEFEEGNIRVKFIELPYTEEDDADYKMSMFIILPESATDFASLEANINKITVEKLLKHGKSQKVFIRLPRFKIESKFELNHLLEQMGMGKVFDQSNADFSGIFPSDVNFRLHKNKVIQKAFIEVNEADSEAGAATTAVVAQTLSFGYQPVVFHADRPFYAIIATTGKHPVNLFTARFTGQE